MQVPLVQMQSNPTNLIIIPLDKFFTNILAPEKVYQIIMKF